ncbi:hypothetical protein CC86DRAFT_383633 [Ophiobolus disseminans]|uniref:Uncharacterized protein n=1 Tax=Ophiobolus disseminans TaxID=1469910 RepID=A0A6A6ZVL2_9PLEO|nr:hypothetical protein CC86DRAFT_383633 [Ophiobolus disseminans]
MAIGYLLESFICLAILCAAAWSEKCSSKNSKLVQMLLANASRAFYDNAAFFAFAMQAASIATLTKVDFGISANGMGALTMQIVWLVSILSLLPLLPLVLRPQLYHENTLVDLSESIVEIVPTSGHEVGTKSISEARAMAISEARQDLRFFFFVVCWAMAFGPFFSRMGGTFGQSRIGDSNDSVISTTDWKQIEDACFLGVNKISRSLDDFVTACGITSYLLVSVIAIGKIANTLLEGSSYRWLKWFSRVETSMSSVWHVRLHRLVSAFVFFLLAVQFWAFFRLRQLQKDMVRAAGGEFSDEQWTFGQIVAVVVYIPVLVEVTFAWRKKSLFCT